MGFDRLYLVLSFDCDRNVDAEAAQRLDPFLEGNQIPRIYAVPGETLVENGPLYRKLAENGAQFINHGALPHMALKDGRFESITFYHEMSRAEIEEDIFRGDRLVTEIVGTRPTGFRSPHFGYMQSLEQRTLLYDIARRLGYRYCSGGRPEIGMFQGPVVDCQGMFELSVFGSLSAPDVIHDSWNYFHESGRLSDRYEVFFRETVDFFIANDLPGVLNYYCDPSHVVDAPCFYRAIEYALRSGVVATDFDGLLRTAGRPVGRANG